MRSAADHTCLDDINADVLNAGINLLADKSGRRVVDVIDALRVLRRQCSRCRHSIAAVSRNHFLIGLEATRMQRVRVAVAPRRQSHLGRGFSRAFGTYAPPELSEPAITRIRLLFMAPMFCCFEPRDGGKSLFSKQLREDATPLSLRVEARRGRHRRFGAQHVPIGPVSHHIRNFWCEEENYC